MYFQHDEAPNITLGMKEYLYKSFPNQWLGHGRTHGVSTEVARPYTSWLLSHEGIIIWTKVDSGAALHHQIFSATDSIQNLPDTTASVETG